MDGYRDYSKEPVREESGIAAYNASSVHFPTLLHILLSQAEKLGYSHICSWQPHGRAFKIYNREKFVEKMAPLFSKQVSATLLLITLTANTTTMILEGETDQSFLYFFVDTLWIFPTAAELLWFCSDIETRERSWRVLPRTFPARPPGSLFAPRQMQTTG
jgi:hypothetical protein